MDTEVLLEWRYTPPECLEQRITVRTADFNLMIESGKAIAKLDPANYDGNPQLKDVVAGEIRSRLQAAQLYVRQPLTLSGPRVTYLHEDGTMTHTLTVACCAHVIVSDSVDIQEFDANGNMIRDTKQERVAGKEALAVLISKHASDVTLQAMLRSLDTAFSDKEDELVHLYEIRDAVASRFSNERDARQAVGLSTKNWSRMGQICNNEPLRQGRHRGRKHSSIRNASAAELGEVRSIAVSLIRGYIDYLEREPDR